MNISQVNLLTFEISNKCNLADIHYKCPIDIHHKEKDKKISMTNESILNFVTFFRNNGFNGHIAFQYYSEPLMNKKRMMDVIAMIKFEFPNQKFLLWTNGTLIPRDISKCDFLSVFNKIIISLYNSKDLKFYNELKKTYANINVWTHWADKEDAGLDNRKKNVDSKQYIEYKNVHPCLRPQKTEFLIDYYGEVRICCVDFLSEVKIGNIMYTDFDSVINQYTIIAQKIENMFLSESQFNDGPEMCKTCVIKTPGMRTK